jgi:fatty acid-binding protein DegV
MSATLTEVYDKILFLRFSKRISGVYIQWNT